VPLFVVTMEVFLYKQKTNKFIPDTCNGKSLLKAGFFLNMLVGVTASVFPKVSTAQHQTASGFSESEVRVQLFNGAQHVALNFADVYANGVLLADDLPVGTSTPFLSVPVSDKIDFAFAPGSSTSAAEAIFHYNATPQAGSAAFLAVHGGAGNTPLAVVSDTAAEETFPSTTEIKVNFYHASAQLPSLNVVLRDNGQMILNALGYLQKSPAVVLSSNDHYLDVKNASSGNLISTNRLSLVSYEGQCVRVLFLGAAATPQDVKIYAVFNDGLSIPVDYAPIGIVQFFNTFSDSLDVYKNGTRFVDNAAPGSAMPFKYIPGGIPMQISLSPYTNVSGNFPATPYANFSYTFENMQVYGAAAAGLKGDSLYPPVIFFTNDMRMRASDPDAVEIRYFNGLYRHAAHTIRINNTSLFEGTTYGDFSEYFSLSPTPGNTISITTQQGEELPWCAFALDTLRGQSLLLYSYYDAGGKAVFQLATSDGKVHELCAFTTAVNTLTQDFEVRAYPNPADEMLRLDFRAVGSDRAVFTVYDLQGRLLEARSQLSLVEGDNSFVFETTTWPVGYAIICLRTDRGYSFTSKIQIIR
jgi:hypothetical protein